VLQGRRWKKRRKKKEEEIFLKYAILQFLLRIYSGPCISDPHIAFADRPELHFAVQK
jgi:hypothetical protein